MQTKCGGTRANMMMLLRIRCLIFYLILYDVIPPRFSSQGTTEQTGNFLVTEPTSAIQGTNSSNLDNSDSKQRIGDTSSKEYNVLSNDRTTEYYTTKGNKINGSEKYSDASVTAQQGEMVITSTDTTAISDRSTSELSIQTGSTSGTTYKPDVCAMYGTCQFVSGLSFVESKYCHCDELCQMYNDCCFDAILNALIETETTPYECIPYSNFNSNFGLYVIKQCPGSLYGTDVDNKCRTNDLLTFGPWVVDDYGMVYHNKFCAECYGKESYRSFSIKISDFDHGNIDHNETTVQRLQAFMMNRGVRFDQVPPEGSSVRHCLIYNSKYSNLSGCLAEYNNPIFDPLLDPPVFRNIYCTPTDAQDVVCLGQIVEDLFSGGQSWYGLYPLSVLFVFEPRNNECRDSINGLCIGKELFRNVKIEFNLELTTSIMVSEEEIKNILVIFLWSLPHVVEPLIVAIGMPDEVDQTSFSTRFWMELLIKEDINTKSKLEYESMLNTYHLEAQVNGNNRTFSAFIDQIDDESIFENRLIFRSGEIIDALRNVKADISTGNESHVFCIKQYVEIDYRNVSAVSIESFECLERIFIGRIMDGEKNIKTVITFVGMGLSVIALVVCIVIYRLFGLHKSVSGSNTENLCIALLLSNVLFLVGVGAYDYWYVCYVIGVCMHYLWLSVFSFMSITLVHMSNVFLSSSISNPSSPDRRFTILRILLPTPFIISSLTLDLMNVPGFKSNYDGNICFPTGYPASILFMSGPIGLSIVVNIVCFICTACVLTNKSRKSKLVKKSNSYQYIGVYARICVITGVFWITGVLGILFQTEVVEFVFIILCSLQGLFVALAHLTTRRVLRIIRNYFVAEQHTHSRNTIRTK